MKNEVLLLNVTPISLKCGLLIKDTDEIAKELENLNNQLQYIQTNQIIKYQGRILLLFKINYFRIEEFKKSQDYKYIKGKLKHISNVSLSDSELEILKNNKDNNEIILESRIKNNLIPKCFFSGELTGKRDFLIFELFKVKCVNFGKSYKLIIKAIEFFNNNQEKSFFQLPKESISNLVSVGERLKQVTEKNYINKIDNLYPYLLVEGQEGISIYRVDSETSYKKIGGNSFGPSTLWSLFTFSCGYQDMDVALSEAEKGNTRQIDLSVGDIYGGNYENMSLCSDLIGSTFGKFKDYDISKIQKKDIAKSLSILYGVTYAHVTSMVSMKENINKTIISGNTFHSLGLDQIIQTSIDLYSNRSIKTIFNDYSEYFEIIGMYIKIGEKKVLNFKH